MKWNWNIPRAIWDHFFEIIKSHSKKHKTTIILNSVAYEAISVWGCKWLKYQTKIPILKKSSNSLHN